MGTKANPGKFDCYGKAAADEPLFTLRAKDPVAPQLVLVWRALRAGEFAQADFHLEMAKRRWAAVVEAGQRSALALDNEKSLEACNVAQAMIEWQENQ